VEQHLMQVGEMIGTALRASGIARTRFHVLPPALAKQIEFKRKRIFLVAAAAIFVVAAFIPVFHFETQAEIHKRQAAELEEELVKLRRPDKAIQASQRQVSQLKQRVSAMEQLAKTKGNWILFLEDLQGRLAEVEDVWLDRMTIVGQGGGGGGTQTATGGLFGTATNQPAQAAGTGGGAIRLNLSGRLLDRQNPLSRVSPTSQQRVNELLASFAESDYIAEVQNEQFDPSEPGILRFEFVLVLNDKQPL